MGRIRTIKPDFFIDDELAALPPLTRLLFIGLWTVADREGRLRDKPLVIKATLLPFDTADTDEMLTALAASGFIARYEADGRKCIQVRNFLIHQRPNVREPESTLPALEDSEHDIARASICTHVQAHACTLGREGKGKEGNGKGRSTCTRASVNALPHTSDAFDVFWQAYPRHVNRAKAEKAWKKINPDADLVARIMASVEAWKQSPQWTKDGGQYIPYASTWLNGRQWEDELPATTTETQFPWLDEFLAGGDEDGTTPDGPAP